MVGIRIKARVGEKGQVVIPKPIREHFNIHQDTELVFDIEEEKIILKKKTDKLEVLENFISAVKKKVKLGKVDWDKEYYSQFD